jgi:hypothetical protein
MSTNRDFNRIAGAWMAEGPNELADRVLEAALDEVHLTNQRRRLAVPWRTPPMSMPLRLAASVAIIAVLGVGAIRLFGPAPNVGAAPSPTPTAAPTPSTAPPSPTASPTAASARMEVQGDAASWTAALPPGWSPRSGWFTAARQGPAGPTGIAVVATGAVNVPSNPCDGIGKVSNAASPADVVAALAARKDLTVATPVAATVSGYAARQVDVEVPADLSACGSDNYILFAEPDGSGFYAQGPSNQLRIWVVDLDGRPVVFFVERFAGTPATDVAAAQQIVDSIVITP